MIEAAEATAAPAGAAPVEGIPIRNVWLLLVYASKLARFRDRFDADLESSPDLPSLLARLLAFVVERRLRRNLSRAYQPRSAVLTRVRGRIDVLDTLAHDRLARGEVACRFEEQTVDTPRNRLVRTALVQLAAQVGDAGLAHECRDLARLLTRLGVSPGRPTRAALARAHIARRAAAARVMVTVAPLALALALPPAPAGKAGLSSLARDQLILHKVFEHAIAGFYEYELGRAGWEVWPQKIQSWPHEEPTPGMLTLLPKMQLDLRLTHAATGRRIVLDTKFTDIVTAGHGGADRLKSAHLYQIYAYLRTQAVPGDGLSQGSEGLLLHPAIGCDVDEAVTLHRHRIRFATVDLASDSEAVRARLLALVRQRT